MRLLCGLGLLVVLAPSRCANAASATATATTSALPTVLSSTRYTIDKYALAGNLESDEIRVSAGAADVYGDSIGSLKTTAVMFRTPAGDGVPYSPQRCDILFFITAGQPTTSLAAFSIILFADDDTDAHNPGARVRCARHHDAVDRGHLTRPLSPAALCPALDRPFRPHPEQPRHGPRHMDSDFSAGRECASVPDAGPPCKHASPRIVQNAAGNWPSLLPSTNYWVAVAPASPLSISSSVKFNGAVWGGLNITTDPIPAQIANDVDTGGNLFTARYLVSQAGARDATRGAGTAAAVNFILSTGNWGSLPSQGRNWAASGSAVRYGLQIFGIQQNPSVSVTGERALSGGRAGAMRRR